jgi:hypothetical protein
MAGVGRAPKDPAKRAGHSPKDPVPLRVVQIVPAEQPQLVDAIGPRNPATGEQWTEGTLRLWDALGEFPTTANLVSAQWLLLARSMILDDALLAGSVTAAGEARLQLAKFGIAPDDVARLRIQFAQADTVEAAAPRRASNRERFGDIRVEQDRPDALEA